MPEEPPGFEWTHDGFSLKTRKWKPVATVTTVTGLFTALVLLSLLAVYLPWIDSLLDGVLVGGAAVLGPGVLSGVKLLQRDHEVVRLDAMGVSLEGERVPCRAPAKVSFFA